MAKFAILPAAAAVAIGGAILFTAAPAMAQDCTLPNDNWSCELRTSTSVEERFVRAGASHMCQYFEAETTTTQWVAINPGNQEHEGNSGTPTTTTGDFEKVGGNVPCPDGTP